MPQNNEPAKPGGRARVGSNNFLEPITALDEEDLAQQLKRR